MNSPQRSHREEPLTGRRRRIGLLITTIALAIWAPFAVKQFTKKEVELPIAHTAIQQAIRPHVVAESRNPFAYPMLPTDRDPRRGSSK